MATAVAIAHPWLHPASQRKSVFRIRQTTEGRWCVSSADGLNGGIFFNHDQAIRFARRESAGAPILVLLGKAAPLRSAALSNAYAPLP